MKKTLALGVISAGIAFALCACNAAGTDDITKLPFNYAPDFSYVDSAKLANRILNVGAILIGDSTEGYSEAHIKGIKEAKDTLEKAGAKVNVSWEYKVPDTNVALTKSKIEALTDANNNIVVTNSYGHQNAFAEFDMGAHANVDYISMTGDLACTAQKANYHNAFCATYQARFLAGYAAGLKIKELDTTKLPSKNFDANGNIKIGYVGAFNYAEVVSGYTAFFLGIQSVVPNVVMTVKYVNSWWDYLAEKNAAADLISQGALVVSQHADSTGAPEACQEAWDQGTVVYNVGYNISMINAAEDCSLTSATNNWAVFYTQAFYNKLIGEPIPRDWCAGFEKGANAITNVNYKCYTTPKDELNNKLKAKAAEIHDGTLKVFDCSKFTVGGEHLTDYEITDGWSSVKGAHPIKHEGSVYYFDESNTEVRSAPYFDIRIDGITETGAAA